MKHIRARRYVPGTGDMKGAHDRPAGSVPGVDGLFDKTDHEPAIRLQRLKSDGQQDGIDSDNGETKGPVRLVDGRVVGGTEWTPEQRRLEEAHMDGQVSGIENDGVPQYSPGKER